MEFLNKIRHWIVRKQRTDDFLCALCFKHISPDDKYTQKPPNYYHEDCVSRGWEEHGPVSNNNE